MYKLEQDKNTLKFIKGKELVKVVHFIDYVEHPTQLHKEAAFFQTILASMPYDCDSILINNVVYSRKGIQFKANS